MTRILLIRHGCIDLLGRVVYGRMPGLHLNAEGRRQAEAASRAIAGRYRLSGVISSPMERTRETAEIIAAPYQIQISIEEAFNEMDVGDWLGKSVSELQDSPDWKQYNRLRSLYSPPGGETLMQVQSRSWAALAGIVRAHAGETAAIVTHGDVIRSLLLLFAGAPLDNILRLEISPGSVSEVVFDGEPQIRTLNETFC
jgi:broad specificity phosphatase PhoE